MIVFEQCLEQCLVKVFERGLAVGVGVVAVVGVVEARVEQEILEHLHHIRRGQVIEVGLVFAVAYPHNTSVLVAPSGGPFARGLGGRSLAFLAPGHLAPSGQPFQETVGSGYYLTRLG